MLRNNIRGLWNGHWKNDRLVEKCGKKLLFLHLQLINR